MQRLWSIRKTGRGGEGKEERRAGKQGCRKEYPELQIPVGRGGRRAPVGGCVGNPSCQVTLPMGFP